MRTHILSVLACLALSGVAQAQSTSFTYQGRLKAGTQLATGLHDFRFRLFDAASGGAQVGMTQCVDNVLVTEGLFTTTIDFGQQFATPNPRFLEIEVRVDTGLDCSNTTGFNLLTGRQPLTAAPLASHAKSAFALDAPDGSPANAVFVDNTGKVGIGTQTPSFPLHIAAPEPVLALQDANNSSAQTGYISLRDSDNIERGWMGYGDFNNPHLSIVNARPSADVALVTTRDIVMTTGNVERIRINTLGSVGIGITPVNFKLDVAGTIRCTTLTQTSSAAFKDDITPLNAGIEELMRLAPVSYVWNDCAPEDTRGKHDLGFIAEEVATVLPDAVSFDANGKAVGIDYSRITVLAVKAIKDQQARHDAELRTLSERLERLEALLASQAK